jgi:2-dehydropantoate 2-reductase
MRIAVIGAGAIGGATAALADRAGHSVAVTARGAQLDAIRTAGLQLTGAWGDHLAHPRATAVLEEKPELAFLSVKAQDATAALAENATFLAGVPLVVVQNGLGGAEEASRLLPDTPVIGALALYAASFLEPGRITITTGGATYLGRLDSTPPDVFTDTVRTVGAFLDTRVTENFTGAQWTKLMVNHVNALPAMTGLSVQETIARPGLRRVLTASMQETIRIARASGVRFESLLGLDDRLLGAVARLPRGVAQLLPRLMGKRMGAVPNPGSTLQSIRRGQLTEIDHLNGAVVAAAAAVGREAPVNAALVDLVHRVERTSAFLTPAEVEAAVPR